MVILACPNSLLTTSIPTPFLNNVEPNVCLKVCNVICSSDLIFRVNLSRLR